MCLLIDIAINKKIITAKILTALHALSDYDKLAFTLSDEASLVFYRVTLFTSAIKKIRANVVSKKANSSIVTSMLDWGIFQNLCFIILAITFYKFQPVWLLVHKCFDSVKANGHI